MLSAYVDEEGWLMTEGDHPTEVTPERVQRYLDLTAKARAKATPLPEEGTPAWDDLQRLLRMADDYASDAAHFLTTGDLVRLRSDQLRSCMDRCGRSPASVGRPRRRRSVHPSLGVNPTKSVAVNHFDDGATCLNQPPFEGTIHGQGGRLSSGGQGHDAGHRDAPRAAQAPQAWHARPARRAKVHAVVGQGPRVPPARQREPTTWVDRPRASTRSRLTLASTAAAQPQASMISSTFPPHTIVAWPMRRHREPVRREMETR